MKTVVTWMGIPESCFFAHVFAHYPDLRLSNRCTEPEQANFDALLLTGGCDISAEYLRQPISDPTLIKEPEPERDAWDSAGRCTSIFRTTRTPTTNG
jgi:putative glutamine amidotransferase